MNSSVFSDTEHYQSPSNIHILSLYVHLLHSLPLIDLSNRVSSVREMSFKLTNENNVLNQYVENLMSASSVFVATNATNATKQRRQRK